ncbi:MAG TPA: glycosyltransferase family 87 protein [Aggregatilineales bacterium]|nr:glycosyltransferase family 87 protein [Aggregatilineales bacterium]
MANPPRRASPSRQIPPLPVAIMILCYVLFGVYTFYWHRTTMGYLGDLEIYIRAMDSVRAGHSAYLPYGIGQSFVYSPVALSLLTTLSLTGEISGFWIAISVIGYGLALTLLLKLMVFPESWQRILALILMAALAPFWETLYVGQINAIVVLCLAACLYYFDREQPTLSGIFLALAILLKTSPVILVIYFVALRQLRVLVAATITGIGLSILSLTQFGLTPFFEFSQVVGRIGTENTASSWNISVVSVTTRFFHAMIIPIDPDTIGSVYKLIFVGITLALAGYVWFRSAHHRDKSARRILFSLFVILMTLSSPLVWYHHSTFLVIPFVLALSSSFPWATASLLIMQIERWAFNAVALYVEHFSAYDINLGRPTLAAGLPNLIGQLILTGIIVGDYIRLSHQPVISNAVLIDQG